MNIPIETDWTVKEVEKLADHVHRNADVGASIASGSFDTDGMIEKTNPPAAVITSATDMSLRGEMRSASQPLGK